MDIAVSREGDTYLLYNYSLNEASRSLTLAETSKLLNQMRTAGEVNIPTDGFNTSKNADVSSLNNQNGYDRYDVTFSLDGKEFTGELLVAIDASDRHTFYDIVKIKKSDSPVSAGIAERGTNASNGGTDSAIGIIPDSAEK